MRRRANAFSPTEHLASGSRPGLRETATYARPGDLIVETALRSRHSPTITGKASEYCRLLSLIAGPLNHLSPHFANALFESGIEIEYRLKGNVSQMTVIQIVM